MEFDENNIVELLPIYYKRLFPFSSFCNWISYNNTSVYFLNREFSFTLENDVYYRYQSFLSEEEFAKQVQKLIPFKIDIGAVYNVKPKDHKSAPNFIPLEKELIFDIDLTDYDDVRTCCSGATVCSKCWKFMTVGIKILDAALREDFGWQYLLWVFSGRRGVHCWVCDKEARRLSPSARIAIVEYLQLVQGNINKNKKVFLPDDYIHPSIRRALEIIKPYFGSVCLEEQDILGTEENTNKILSLFPNMDFQDKAKKLLAAYDNSLKKWKALKKIIDDGINTVQFKFKKFKLIHTIGRAKASLQKYYSGNYFTVYVSKIRY